MKLQYFSGVFGLMLLGIVAVSCEHKELCYDHPSHAPRYATNLTVEYDYSWEKPHEGNTDWKNNWKPEFGVEYESLLPGTPEGLRVSSYNEYGVLYNNNIEPYGEEIHLSPGMNSLLVYNNDTEHIIFNDMDSYVTASVNTRVVLRGSYTGNPMYVPTREPNDGKENTVTMPDVLYGYYRDEYFQEKSTEASRLHITMHPLVFTYLIRFEITKGLEYVALARGALSGMAESVYLHSGRTSKTPATFMYDCTFETWGAKAIVSTFGVPDFPNPDYTRAEDNFAVNLEMRLKNGKIINKYFDVSEQLRKQPHGGVITITDIEISENEGSSGGGAFDVTVDGWGEYQDVEVILK